MNNVMKFKKIIVVYILIASILLFSSCSKASPYIEDISIENPSAESSMYDIYTLTDDDFSVYDYGKNKSILLGCTVSDIEKTMNVTIENKGIASYVGYEGIILSIRNEIYCGGYIIQAYDNMGNTFKTFRGICLGSTFDQIKKVYGEPTFMQSYNVANYVYQKENEQYKLLTENEKTDNTKEYYYIQFMLSNRNTVTMISVGDYDFLYNMK
ncbi:MAG: hypothetical protein IJ333_05060 [Clostridia bacterium]|nr:hypothetical protein [Clostridia bacterium]